MRILNKFLCCLSLRTGGIAIGVFESAFSMAGFILVIVAMAQGPPPAWDQPGWKFVVIFDSFFINFQNFSALFWIAMSFALALNLFSLVISLLLINGSVKVSLIFIMNFKDFFQFLFSSESRNFSYLIST